MATKGFRQPYRWDHDGSVWSYIGGKKQLVWVAPDWRSAFEFCEGLIAEFQVATYGQVDPYGPLTLRNAAAEFHLTPSAEFPR